MKAHRDASFLAKLLTQSLGASVAELRVGDAVRALQRNPTALTQDDAFAVLEHLAKEKGIVGSTARFAKVRLALQWDAD